MANTAQFIFFEKGERTHEVHRTTRVPEKRRWFGGRLDGLADHPAACIGAGQTPPSEKVNIAGIGIGGQGGHDIRQLESENIVALCDVDQRRAAGLLKAFPKASVPPGLSQDAR